MQNTQTINSITVSNKINNLSMPLLIEANSYIDYLIENNNNFTQKNIKKKPIKAGFAKGFFVMMPDFDEPLDDFKEYMP